MDTSPAEWFRKYSAPVPFLVWDWTIRTNGYIMSNVVKIREIIVIQHFDMLNIQSLKMLAWVGTKEVVQENTINAWVFN